MPGVTDERGEAWARRLFESAGFSVYVPHKDRGADLVVTSRQLGTGRQIEVQVKYTEEVYSGEGKGHYCFNLLPLRVENFPRSRYVYLMLLGVPLVFDKARKADRNRLMKAMREGKYLIPFCEVKKVMDGGGPQDRLGVDENGHPLLGARRFRNVDWRKYKFRAFLGKIRTFLASDST